MNEHVTVHRDIKPRTSSSAGTAMGLLVLARADASGASIGPNRPADSPGTR